MKGTRNAVPLQKVMALSSNRTDVNGNLPPKKLVQCRICHEEDEPSKLEAPCGCCGSLKYAHRRCVQLWCNEKGNIVCEICLQQFKPGYLPPPPKLPFAIIPMHVREAWELPVTDRHDHPSITYERDLFEHSFDDYPAPTASIICCRVLAVIFMVLIVLRHTLPIVIDGSGEYTFTLYTLLMLRTIGILLPMFVMFKVCSIFRQQRRHRQVSEFHFATSDEENELAQRPLPGHYINV